MRSSEGPCYGRYALKHALGQSLQHVKRTLQGMLPKEQSGCPLPTMGLLRCRLGHMYFGVCFDLIDLTKILLLF